MAYIPPTRSIQSNFTGTFPELNLFVNYENYHKIVSKFKESAFLYKKFRTEGICEGVCYKSIFLSMVSTMLRTIFSSVTFPCKGLDLE